MWVWEEAHTHIQTHTHTHTQTHTNTHTDRHTDTHTHTQTHTGTHLDKTSLLFPTLFFHCRVSTVYERWLRGLRRWCKRAGAGGSALTSRSLALQCTRPQPSRLSHPIRRRTRAWTNPRADGTRALPVRLNFFCLCVCVCVCVAFCHWLLLIAYMRAFIGSNASQAWSEANTAQAANKHDTQDSHAQA